MLPKKRRMYSNNGGSLSVWDQAQFFAPLKTTLVLSRGTGSPTFTRATTAYVKDFEGVWREVPSGAARFEGARVVRNLVPTVSESPFSSLNIGSITKASGVADPDGGTSAITLTSTGATQTAFFSIAGTRPSYLCSTWVRRRTGTGTVIFINPDNSRTTDITSQIAGGWVRVSSAVTAPNNGTTVFWGFQINTSGDAIDVAYGQAEDVTGQSNQFCSDYVSVGVLSAPYHGAGVDGCAYFDYENPWTVSGNVATDNS